MNEIWWAVAAVMAIVGAYCLGVMRGMLTHVEVKK